MAEFAADAGQPPAQGTGDEDSYPLTVIYCGGRLFSDVARGEYYRMR